MKRLTVAVVALFLVLPAISRAGLIGTGAALYAADKAAEAAETLKRIEAAQKGSFCQVEQNGPCAACAIKCPDGVAAKCSQSSAGEGQSCGSFVCRQEASCVCSK